MENKLKTRGTRKTREKLGKLGKNWGNNGKGVYDENEGMYEKI